MNNLKLSVACAWLLLATIGQVAAQIATAPVPRTYKSGPSIKFDFPGMLVGVAEYDEGPTGTTVFYFPNGFKGAVDVRGGSPGELNASALKLSLEDKMMDAVVFSGGSWYGLSAATGVANGLKDQMAAKGNVDFIAGVVAAIIYDVGGRRYSRVTPDDALGRAALASAEPGWFPLGARGAGRFAMQGVYFNRGDAAANSSAWPHSGQGGAFRNVGPTKIGVFTIVNSLGSIVDRDGRVVRCGRNTLPSNCPTIADKLRTFAPIATVPSEQQRGKSENTTLTLVVTNQKMPYSALQRLAMQVHSSMARAIQPFATSRDGDILYAATTDEVDNPSLSDADLSVIASEVAWDAVLSSVPEVPPMPAVLRNKPDAAALRRFAGSYIFRGGPELKVTEAGGQLVARCIGFGRIYFDKEKDYQLTPAENGLFIIESPGREVIRFDEAGGKVAGLTLNPGPWALQAQVR